MTIIYLDGLSDEINRILLYYRAYHRTIERMVQFNEWTRAEMVDMIVALKCIENDLVIRLCKLDDRRKDTISFKNALKVYKKFEIDIDKILKAQDKHEEFITATSILRERRNEELAHLSKGKLDHYDPRFELLHIIRLAVEITDFLHGRTIKYRWKDDHIYEDLRNLIYK